MTYTEFLSIIVPKFEQGWNQSQLAPIEHENCVLENKETLDEWLRLSVVFANSKSVNLQNDAVRRGSVYVQIFTKSDIGQGRAIVLADEAGKIFAKKIIDKIVFSNYDVNVLGKRATSGLTTTETPWFQVTVAIDFQFLD